MGLKDALRRFFRPTSVEKADKLQARIINMYGQTADRRYYLGQLQELGSELAPKRLILRFTCCCENGTTDAEEKELTKSLLIELGEASVEPLKHHLRTRDKDFNWPYRTLSELLSHEAMVEFLVELLERIGPEYVRDPERKEQLMLVVKSFEEEAIAKGVLLYLNDDNETIRFVAADAAITHALPEGIEALASRLTEETSQRVLALIAEAFRDKGWVVPEPLRAGVSENLPQGFRLNAKGYIL